MTRLIPLYDAARNLAADEFPLNGDDPDTIFACRHAVIRAFEAGAAAALNEQAERMREWRPWNFENVADTIAGTRKDLTERATAISQVVVEDVNGHANG